MRILLLYLMDQGLRQKPVNFGVSSNTYQQLNQKPDPKQKQRKSRQIGRCGKLLGLVDELKKEKRK